VLDVTQRLDPRQADQLLVVHDVVLQFAKQITATGQDASPSLASS
jgi:hypothetical protein